jgi:hypothetical protein
MPFLQVDSLLHDLDDGMRPISVFFPYLPTSFHKKRDLARIQLGKIFAKVRQQPVPHAHSTVLCCLSRSPQLGAAVAPCCHCALMLAPAHCKQMAPHPDATPTPHHLYFNTVHSCMRHAAVCPCAQVIRSRRSSPVKEEDVLQQFCDARYQNVYNGRQLTEEEIAGLLIAVLFAGQHTSSITSSWTGYFMINDKVRQERFWPVYRRDTQGPMYHSYCNWAFDG